MEDTELQQRIRELVDHAIQKHKLDIVEQFSDLNQKVTRVDDRQETMIAQVHDVQEVLNSGVVSQVHAATDTINKMSEDLYDVKDGIAARLRDIEARRDNCKQYLKNLDEKAEQAKKDAAEAKELSQVSKGKIIGYVFGASAVGSVMVWLITLIRTINWK